MHASTMSLLTTCCEARRISDFGLWQTGRAPQRKRMPRDILPYTLPQACATDARSRKHCHNTREEGMSRKYTTQSCRAMLTTFSRSFPMRLSSAALRRHLTSLCVIIMSLVKLEQRNHPMNTLGAWLQSLGRSGVFCVMMACCGSILAIHMRMTQHGEAIQVASIRKNCIRWSAPGVLLGCQQKIYLAFRGSLRLRYKLMGGTCVAILSGRKGTHFQSQSKTDPQERMNTSSYSRNRNTITTMQTPSVNPQRQRVTSA